MNKKSDIIRITKKTIAVLLLFYFVFSPLLFALPTNDCAGSCDMNSNIHTCSIFKHIQNDCCKSDISDLSGNSCDMELSADNCMSIVDVISAKDYVVTPKFKSLQNFVVVSTIELNEDNTDRIIFESTNTFTFSDKLPIFKLVQSFLN